MKLTRTPGVTACLRGREQGGRAARNNRLRPERFLWKSFRTGVQLPPPPPQSKGSNPRPGSTVQIRSIAVYRSTFGIVLDTSGYDAGQCDPDCPPTYAAIQKWIEDNHGVKVSKSSVTMVKDKCGALKLDFKAGKEPDSGIIKTAKERLVLEAFRAFGVV